MDKQFIEARLVKTGDRLEFVATDETLDRQGEVIPIDSWDLGNFKKNPVLLVNHEYKVQNIVGRAEGMRFSERGGRKTLVFEPVFHNLTQLAREVEAMVRENVLSTVSVGFMRRAPTEDGDKQVNELMEVSFVPVPANPSAERIKSLIDPQLTPDEEKKVKDFAEEKEGRVLSGKNRSLISETVATMKASLGALETLLEATDKPDKAAEKPQKTMDASGHGETHDTPTLGKGKADKGRAGGNNVNVKVLQRVAKEINHAIYQAKRN